MRLISVADEPRHRREYANNNDELWTLAAPREDLWGLSGFPKNFEAVRRLIR